MYPEMYNNSQVSAGSTQTLPTEITTSTTQTLSMESTTTTYISEPHQEIPPVIFMYLGTALLAGALLTILLVKFLSRPRPSAPPAYEVMDENQNSDELEDVTSMPPHIRDMWYEIAIAERMSQLGSN